MAVWTPLARRRQRPSLVKVRLLGRHRSPLGPFNQQICSACRTWMDRGRQPPRSPEEKIRDVATVDGIAGIELKYPGYFENSDRIKELLAETGLVLAAVNVDIKDAAHFRFGALSAAEHNGGRLPRAR